MAFQGVLRQIKRPVLLKACSRRSETFHTVGKSIWCAHCGLTGIAASRRSNFPHKGLTGFDLNNPNRSLSVRFFSIGKIREQTSVNLQPEMSASGSTTSDAVKIFKSAVKAVLPREMIDKALQYDPITSQLRVQERTFKLNRNLYVVGFGKAVLGMARAVEDVLRDQMVEGILSVPLGIQEFFGDRGKSELLLQSNSKFKVYEGARDNLPDEAAYHAAQAIHRLVSRLGEGDVVIVLISGGGSALLPSPHPPITLDEEMRFTRLLSGSGAVIQELNMIRKNIELLKGGGLAEAATPAQVISLILSDVVGDPLDIISSGPTVPDTSTANQCLILIDKFQLASQAPESIMNYLKEKSGTVPVPSSEDFNNVLNVIVGSNRIALDAASTHAESMGYVPLILTSSQVGNAADVGVLFAAMARLICLAIRSKKGDKGSQELSLAELELVKTGLGKAKVNEIYRVVHQAKMKGCGVIVIAGGETTVYVQGTGKGGRNMEMALSCGIALKEVVQQGGVGKGFHVEFLSGATDGIDGPTEAAGAVIGPDFCDVAKRNGVDPVKYLQNNDSYTIFHQLEQGEYMLNIGHTGTNVMDLQVLLVKPE